MNRVIAVGAAAVLVALGIAVTATMAIASPTKTLNRAPALPAAKHHAKIVARPDKAIAGQHLRLVGSGFKPSTKLVIQECSQATWVVPAEVCNRHNAVKIKTGPHGGFATKFQVRLCPATRSPATQSPATRSPATAATTKRCFIGVPTIDGIDVVTLLGVTKVTVTRK